MVREAYAAMPVRGFVSVSLTPCTYYIVAFSLPFLVSWL
jgi:hypothetical protein